MITIRKIYKSLFYQKFMRHKLAKIGAGLALLVAGPTTAHATGLAEETIPYTPEPTSIEYAQDNQEQYPLPSDTIITSFDYISPIRDGQPRTFQLLRDGTVNMRGSNYNFVMGQNSQWFYDVDNSGDVTPVDEPMRAEYNSTFTTEMINALIRTKEELAYQIYQNTEFAQTYKNSLEDLALMEARLKQNEENTQEDIHQYSLQIAKLQDSINNYKINEAEDLYPDASPNEIEQLYQESLQIARLQNQRLEDLQEPQSESPQESIPYVPQISESAPSTPDQIAQESFMLIDDQVQGQ